MTKRKNFGIIKTVNYYEEVRVMPTIEELQQMLKLTEDLGFKRESAEVKRQITELEAKAKAKKKKAA